MEKPKHQIGDIIVSPIRPNTPLVYQLVIRSAHNEYGEWKYNCSRRKDSEQYDIVVPEKAILFNLTTTR